MNSNVHANDVIVIGQDLPYEDGAEDEILTILQNASDCSAGSDELASHIRDWPTRYHLSRLRQNLFLPFTITSDMRVLEIGCETGVNLRVMAERGAEVIGVEGTLSRARAARARCKDLPNVTVYAGNYEDLPDIGLFDVVLLIGVLEYSGASFGGKGGPDQLLQTARNYLKTGGQLILAIENQLGLKYLLSYPEDHLGLPWIGVEGYHSTSGIRTWSRAQLSTLLQKNGFVQQRWMYPFPDYKLPIFIASEDLFLSDQGRHLVKNVMRAPVVDYSGQPALVCDATSAFQTMVEAHLGPDISNSFLITASASPGATDLIESQEVGWLASGERKSKWRRERTILNLNSRFVFTSKDSQPNQVSEDWLTNTKEPDVNFIAGIPLDDLILQSLSANDINQMREYLEMYRDFLNQNINSSGHCADGPFSSPTPSTLLPPDFLDCTPKNLLMINDRLEFIDREWVANSPISLEHIWIRGVFEISNEMIRRGIIAPFDPKERLPDLIKHISGIAGIKLDRAQIQRFLLKSEASFQNLVTDSITAQHFENLLDFCLKDVMQSLPIRSQIHYSNLVELQNRQFEQQNHQLQQQIDLSNKENSHLRLQLESSIRVNQSLSSKSDRQLLTISKLRQQADSLQNSSSYKLGNLIVRPFAFLKRLVKR